MILIPTNGPGPVPEQPSWINGLNNQTYIGYPPSTWVQGADGKWFPPTVVAPVGIPNSGGGTTNPGGGGDSGGGGSTGGSTGGGTGGSGGGGSTTPPNVLTPPVNASLTFTVLIDVNQNPSPNQLIFDTVFNVFPPAPIFGPYTASIATSVDIIPIPLPFEFVMDTLASIITSGSVANFFDNTRQLKTLLNFGNDFQQLITNWKLDKNDPNTIDVKLYEPLPGTVDEKTQLWITQELTPPIVDRFDFVFNPLPPALVYLRPPNTNIQVTGQQGSSIENATLQSLLTTSSYQPVQPTSPILEQFYTYDINQTELNIAYNDYRNFVFYGSAQARLNAFINKLYLLFNVENLIAQNSQSLVAIGGTGSITGTLAYTALQDYGAQRLDILRSFDPYERFLYYDTLVPYSSSLGVNDDSQDQVYFNADCTYPKYTIISGSINAAAGTFQSIVAGDAPEFPINSLIGYYVQITGGTDAGDLQIITSNGDQRIGIAPASFRVAPDVTSVFNIISYSGSTPLYPTSASAWYATQSAIATAYDVQNPFSFANSLPQFITTDVGSIDYITFFNMVGHQFDILKPYIDQMTLIYDRNSDPTKGLSPDIIWNVAKAFGIELPNQYSVSQLLAYTVGSGSLSGSAAANPKLYSELAAQTWKRFLHNQIHLMKAKGTKDALKTLLNVYGVIPSAIKIRESATPNATTNATGTYETFKQHTNVLPNLSGTYVQIPFATGGLINQSIELTFASPNPATKQVLLNTLGNAWAVSVVPITGSYGYVLVQSASVPAVSSSGLQLYSGNFYSVLLRGDSSTTLEVKRYANGNIVESSVTQETGSTLSASLGKPAFVFLGGSGSFYGTPFTGYVDEYRQWGELTTDATFNLYARYPGQYHGNTSGSALTSLYVRLSFNKPQNLGLTSSLPNESPFVRTSACPPIFASCSAIGFTSGAQAYPFNFSIITRDVQRYTPTAGSQWTSNRVVIAPTPVASIPSGSVAPILSLNNSAVNGLADKKAAIVSTNRIGFYFSVADAIDDSILRSMGILDLNNLLGDPADVYNTSYQSLVAIRQFYQTNYSPNFNTNAFVNFLSNLLNPIFTQAKTLVPARTQLLTGIVHEPSILDRSKIDPRNITFGAGVYGPDYRDTPNLSGSVGSVQPSASAGFETVTAKVTRTGSFVLSASYNTVATRLVVSGTLNITAINETLSGTIVAPSGNSVYRVSAQPEFFSASIQAPSGTLYTISAQPRWLSPETTRQNFSLALLIQNFGVTSIAQLTPSQLVTYIQLITAYQNTNIINLPTIQLNAKFAINGVFVTQSNIQSSPSTSISTVLQPQIEMFCNFNTFEATTYFWRPDGLMAIETTSLSPFNQSMNARGLWTYGTTYARNDWVIFSGSSVLSGTQGQQFFSSSWICITPQITSGSFVSIIPPYADQQNWQPVKFIPCSSLAPREAIVVTGSIYGNVSLAPSGTGLTLAQGYLPQHFRFNHNKATGWENARFKGCLQTSGTTTDGLAPVTIGFSEGDQLIVNNPQGPVQPVQGASGPILRVT